MEDVGVASLHPFELLRGLQFAAQLQCGAVELQGGPFRAVLRLNGILAEPVGLGQVRTGVAEAERRAFHLPRQRHAAAVTANLHTAVPEERGVLALGVENFRDLLQAQLLTLVEVGRARECEHQQGGSACTPEAQLHIQFPGGGAGEEPGLAVLAPGVLAGAPREAVTGGVADHVVVGEHPRGRGACVPGFGQVAGDDFAVFHGIEVCLEQVEVEGLAQSCGTRIAGAAGGVYPRFGHGRARRVVLVEDCTPLCIDLMDFVAVPERVGAVVEAVCSGVGHAELQLGKQRFGQVLGQRVGHVHAEAVHTAVGPEAEGLEEVIPDLAAGPVQVRLLLGEDVHVPLAGRAVRFGDAFPGRSAEDRVPVRRRQLAVGALAVTEDVAFARRRALRRRECLLEPFVPVRGVVGDDVRDQLDAGGVQGFGHLIEVRQGAQLWVHVAVVVHVVAAIGQRRRVERAEPHGVDAQRLEVWDLGRDAPDVTQAVGVGIGETARIDLVNSGLAPPVRIAHVVGIGHGRQHGSVRQRNPQGFSGRSADG